MYFHVSLTRPPQENCGVPAIEGSVWVGNKESDEGLMAIPTGKTFGEIGIWNVTFDDNGNPFNLLKPLGAGSVSINNHCTSFSDRTSFSNHSLCHVQPL